MPSPALAKFATQAAQATRKRSASSGDDTLQDSLRDALSDDIGAPPSAPASTAASSATAPPDAA